MGTSWVRLSFKFGEFAWWAPELWGLTTPGCIPRILAPLLQQKCTSSAKKIRGAKWLGTRLIPVRVRWGCIKLFVGKCLTIVFCLSVTRFNGKDSERGITITVFQCREDFDAFSSTFIRNKCRQKTLGNVCMVVHLRWVRKPRKFPSKSTG